MFHNRSKKLLTILAGWGLAGLFFAAAFTTGTGAFARVGGAVIYFSFAGILGLLSIRSRFEKQFLSTGYLAYLVGFLNYYAAGAARGGSVAEQIAMGVCGSLVFCLFTWTLLWPAAPDAGGLVESEARRKLTYRIKAAMMLGYVVASSITIALAIPSQSAPGDGAVGWPRWNGSQYALLFIGIFSVFLTLILRVRSRAFNPPFRIRPRLVAYFLGILLLAGTYEYISRRNWLLFTLSSLAFVGAYTALCQACQPPQDRAAQSNAGVPNPVAHGSSG